MRFPVVNVVDAVDRVRDLITEIDGALS